MIVPAGPLEEAASSPLPVPCERVNPSTHVGGKGGESGRPVTLRHRGAWAWMCTVCGATEVGFGFEHHARTLGDEHTIVHRFDDIDGGSTFGPVDREVRI